MAGYFSSADRKELSTQNPGKHPQERKENHAHSQMEGNRERSLPAEESGERKSSKQSGNEKEEISE